MTAATQSEPLRVLVVEDKPINRQVLGLILETVNARTTFAENGLEGVRAYQEDPFDVVLMDLRMPVMDGYQATREIRAVEAARRTPRTPVIVVSAHTRPHEIQAAQQAGADHHLGKPVSVPALLGAIQGATHPL
jgi:CheY-like chemotaxis protein